MNLLFLTEVAPFPPNGGEKLRSYGLLKLLSELDLTVDAITGSVPDDDLKALVFKNITFHPYKFCYDYEVNNTGSFNKFTRYFRHFSREKGLVDLINKILSDHPVDVAFIDYHLYGQYIGLFRERRIPVILGTHNAQAVLLYQTPADTIKAKISRVVEFLANRLHEMYYFRKADALVVVSENDLQYHKAFIRKDKIYLIPNFLIESDYSHITREKEDYILMTANFGSFQNSIGLEWFIREVWDSELWERARFLIVGTFSDQVFNELKDKYNVTNITAVGKVEDLKPYIAAAAVSIVPLLHGSGSRLKCLESMAMKTQLISTSKGAEGIDHNHSIILADSPAAFKQAILDFLDGKADFTKEAYRAFTGKYSLPPNKAILQEIIRRIVRVAN